MGSGNLAIDDVERALKRAAVALNGAGVTFLVGGSLACWVRGGPEPRKDIDLMVRPADAERALDALVEAGMRPERPPENWLLKAWDGEVLIDLIFCPRELPITDEVIARSSEESVFALQMLVMSLEDVLVTKLMALTEHQLDYEGLLQVARAVREQVDWSEVRARTADSPYARAFMALLAELGVVARDGQPAQAPDAQRARIKVVPG